MAGTMARAASVLRALHFAPSLLLQGLWRPSPSRAAICGQFYTRLLLRILFE